MPVIKLKKQIILAQLILQLVLTQFDLTLPATTSSQNLQSKISLENKQVYVIIDLTQTYLEICCKPNRDIFAIIHSFLSNPFFQINQYTCPSTRTGYEQSQINLPTIGVIKMSHSITQYPQCKQGILGLSKQSLFLNYLPVNLHTIQIQIGSKETSLNNKVAISFGQIKYKVDSAWVFASKDKQFWNINAKSIQLGTMVIQEGPNVVFTTIGPPIVMSIYNYQQLVSYFVTSQTCKIVDDKLICLCQSGIPAFFPKFIINFGTDQQLTLSPQTYMQIDSNICKLLFKSSQNKNWLFNVAYFSNTIFYFDRNNAQITIQKKQIARNQSSQLIHLPIQLILNCAVILLLCIFVSLVLIEMMKRISGYSQIGQQNIREYIIRRNIGQD